MPHKLKYTNEKMIELAQEFFQKNNVPPRQADFKPGYVVTVVKRFKSWGNYIDKALHLPANYRNWKREELQEILRKFWEKNKRFPPDGELMEDGRDVSAIIKRFWGTKNKYFEATIGTSPRIEVLRAILELTPPGCDQATPAEINALLQNKMSFSKQLYAYTIRELSADGFITGGKYDRTGWWKLTPAGKSFLISFVEGTHSSASAPFKDGEL
jgi:hypothetical protein